MIFYLLNILESIGKIIKHVEDSTNSEDFVHLNDQLNYNATLMLLSNISESLSKLSDMTQSHLVLIDLKFIKGMRNRIVHDYTGLYSFIIFDVAKNKIEGLREAIESIVTQNINSQAFDINELNVFMGNSFYKNVRFNKIKAS